MKFHYPNRLELWAIGLCSVVSILALLSHGTILSKVCYIAIFCSMVLLILTNQNNERD